MNKRTFLTLAPAWLALMIILAGCGLSPKNRIASASELVDKTSQPLPGEVWAGVPAWKGALTPTSTPFSVATATIRPTAFPTYTASPTETQLPLALDPACLLGTWETANLAQAMGESLAGSGGTLALEGVEGYVQYRFNADGMLEIYYQHLSAVLSGTVEERQVRVVHTLDGSGFAQYIVDPIAGEIHLSAFGGEGINSSLSINEQILAEGNLPVWQAFAAGPPDTDTAGEVVEVTTSRAVASCQGNSLTLQAIDPAPGPVVSLFRAQ